ncbi:MAG TPA: hypothetical protein V6C78_20115 [Crinalium sp.]
MSYSVCLVNQVYAIAINRVLNLRRSRAALNLTLRGGKLHREALLTYEHQNFTLQFQKIT